VQVFGVNDRAPEEAMAWVARENLPFRVLADPSRAIGLAYGIAQPGVEKYVANNAEGRRPAVIIDERGYVLRVLPGLRTVEEQREALATL
jgi:peroxiredoxin